MNEAAAAASGQVPALGWPELSGSFGGLHCALLGQGAVIGSAAVERMYAGCLC